MTMVVAFLIVIAGGCLGALARHLVQQLVARHTAWSGWVAILVINVVGSLIIGFSVALLGDDLTRLDLSELNPFQRSLDALALNELMALIAVGFSGAFTTFSTFSLDNYLLSIDRRGRMLFNMIGSTVLAFGGAALGWYLGGLATAS